MSTGPLMALDRDCNPDIHRGGLLITRLLRELNPWLTFLTLIPCSTALQRRSAGRQPLLDAHWGRIWGPDTDHLAPVSTHAGRLQGWAEATNLLFVRATASAFWRIRPHPSYTPHNELQPTLMARTRVGT
jgi:hypothetical protein